MTEPHETFTWYGTEEEQKMYQKNIDDYTTRRKPVSLKKPDIIWDSISGKGYGLFNPKYYHQVKYVYDHASRPSVDGLLFLKEEWLSNRNRRIAYIRRVLQTLGAGALIWVGAIWLMM